MISLRRRARITIGRRGAPGRRNARTATRPTARPAIVMSRSGTSVLVRLIVRSSTGTLGVRASRITSGVTLVGSPITLRTTVMTASLARRRVVAVTGGNVIDSTGTISRTLRFSTRTCV